MKMTSVGIKAIVKSRCVDHDEDVVRGYGGSGLDCSTDDHFHDYIEHALTCTFDALRSEERYRAGSAETPQRLWI
jgi:hypothetical protein